MALLLPIGAAAGGPPPAADRIDHEWRERFVMGYFAELQRDSGLAQRRASAELTATRQSGDLRSQLQAAARYLLVTDSALLDCKLAKDFIEAARSAGAGYVREYFDVAVAAASNMSPHKCPGLMDTGALQALALQLGDPARQFFVLETKVPGLANANRFNDIIEVRVAQLNYAIGAFQRGYCMIDLVQATLRAGTGSAPFNAQLEGVIRELADSEFASLRTGLEAMMFRSRMAAGDLKGALQLMEATLPAVRRGILGPHESAFYLISFARALARAQRHAEALALLEESKQFNAPAKTISGFRSIVTLEVLTRAGTPKAFALGLREVQHLNWLLADKSEFGPQHNRSYKLTISMFFEKFGRHDAALAALKEANQAAEDVQRLAGETARVELQEKLNVAAKDKENAQLKAEAELHAERQRGWVVAFGIALLGGVLAAVALGMAVRRGRRLASVSAELAQRNGELEQRSASRIRLLAAACHDLRQPAHALGMLAELGSDARRDPSRFAAWLQRVRRSTASLSEMLDALMDLGRLDNGQYTPHTGHVSLAELLHDVTLHFGGLAQRKGLRLDVTAAEGEVVSDRHLLRRIVFNLVSNAIKYTDTGQVHVSLERGSHTVLLTVQDSGPGIPPDKLEDVFRDYVRLNPTKATEGLGIGLSIVRRAAELLGHPLSLESPPGQGTTATLQLPLAADRAGRLVAQAAPTADAPQGGVIGLLEDDADVREATAALLRRWGYTVHAAARGSSLKEQLDPSRPQLSLLLSDLHLGSLNGLDEVAKLREALQAPELPALLVTGDMDAAVALQAAQARVYVAHKPLAPGRLAEIVQNLIRAARQAEPRAAAQGVT